MKITYSISDLAKHINAKIIGNQNASISRIAPISRAQSGDLTYLSASMYRPFLQTTQASAVIVTAEDAALCKTTALVVQNPELAYARIAPLFHPFKKPAAGIHSSAVISKTAVIDHTASIGALCVVGDNVKIGANTIVLPNTIIYDDAVIGANCFLHSQVTVHHQVIIGDRVILHSGAVIGADGFGLAQENGRFEKIPQLGSVHIANDVEIGANSCVDRGAIDHTVIEHDVKIDNLVQIAHNVVIGAYTVIAGCASVAGSTRVGRHCIIGGAVTIGGHLTITDGVIFSGCAMVTKSVSEPGIYSSGTGLMTNAQWRRNAVRFRQLDEWIEKLKTLMRGSV
ncbi:MAG: UDP-3-O-(3-hydroxymyristoyl)glucosamine N-acyltransferase [Gammaproteobacteria bacterium RIFCSPLOWO2_02_FULL_42_14]|nr:MAG: UDP-3-O-(3-hydroxymyristoyl)glucosamine N-acyltransferase [Gammaproteobacteria bacterium RIFCSPHIGHO2_02_FULL_42_43]OGT27434.1 MAG: UDP-3-O-(3-hydroxymyristoyl)glucosamine N-acyltransferase [Gammaproteobacteria bacterium RIFCSPHIGHO2_01_FULL_42_8]OGT52356.1 MAG: UDP-3-O-(3-hydroxymyristoyl)glucosamine N-acyltransferase [Gammaproteobacteria bacterium RIFCSPHIGHO2_12_FULL_41_25]OGT63354.1 MAG: UDP-3-O-(3-hydroxymyristoyl)glucosamine N-acyltransferase [Gammaproteobacteria bacterium RIFCSPLO